MNDFNKYLKGEIHFFRIRPFFVSALKLSLTTNLPGDATEERVQPLTPASAHFNGGGW